ncbi:hypothetical protein ZWY2020_023813 [Hordeum vulgare]|nr:hypothetical protein ZWY2020_023813 [Hordeum vulgare]
MDAVQDTTSLQAAIRWLLHTILPSLGKLDGWIRQAGLGSEVEGLREEVEQVDGVVCAVNARSEMRNRSLARSLAALKELLYAADDVVDELDCYSLQHQLHAQGGSLHWRHPNEIDGPTSSSIDGTTRNASADGSSRRKRRRGEDSTDVTAANTGPWNMDQVSERIQDITGSHHHVVKLVIMVSRCCFAAISAKAVNEDGAPRSADRSHVDTKKPVRKSPCYAMHNC